MAQPASVVAPASAATALRLATRNKDLIGLRDALAAHAEAAAGLPELAEAQAMHDLLLASTVNDRHEEWLEEQEWPGAANDFFSRAGHPLATPLRRPWPRPTARAPHLNAHAAECTKNSGIHEAVICPI